MEEGFLGGQHATCIGNTFYPRLLPEMIFAKIET